MIRVYKHGVVPASLANAQTYNGEDVLGQLQVDQHKKCYLCERILSTDFQVEHLNSQTNRPELVYDWNNLFFACSYCNGKKSNRYDTEYNPSENNVEDEIIQSIDFSTNKVIFSAAIDKNGITKTIELLERLFNGTNSMRKIKEEEFYNAYYKRISHFTSLLNDYTNNHESLYKDAIIEELEIKQEYLGFKYHILKRTSLFDEFKDYMLWNKQ